MKTLKQIDFNDALKRTQVGERVYAIDLSTDNKITVKLFSRLEIANAINTEYLYVIVEEVQE